MTGGTARSRCAAEMVGAIAYQGSAGVLSTVLIEIAAHV
jgi:hypothetical protein